MKPFILLLLLFLLIAGNVAAQGQKRLYDHWTTIVTSNASRGSVAPARRDATANFVAQGSRWDRRILTYFFASGTNDIPGNDEYQSVREGFALWSVQTDLAFLEVCSQAEADIVILWGAGNHGDPYPFDGPSGVLAHGFFPPPGGGAYAGDMHFDEDENWTTSPVFSSSIDLVTVAAHEIGHVLGLDHTSIAGSLMVPYYSGPHRYLGSDDKAGIQNVYGIPGSNLISGPTVFCPSTTFGVINQPSATSVTWSSSNTNVLVINPSTGVATTIGNGIATIAATITNGCGSTSITRTVRTGLPDAPFAIDGFTDPYLWRIKANANTVQGATSYNWYKNGIMHSQHGQFVTIPITRGDCNASYDIQVEAINACGVSSRTARNFDTQCNQRTTLTVYPNPTSDQLVVESTDTTGQAVPNEFEATLFDKYSRAQKAEHTQTGRVEMATRDLPAGMYFLEVKQGNAIQRKRVLIQK